MQVTPLKVKAYPKFQNETFLHIEAFQPLKVGSIYRFLEYPDLHFVRQCLCVDVKTIPLGEVSDQLSFLDKDCDREVFLEIMEQKNISLTAPVYVGTFTNSGNSKKHYLCTNL